MANRANGLFSKLSLFGRRKAQQRHREAARYARRSLLRLESLENRYAMHGAHLDLAAESDLGASNSDDITSATTWVIQASGVGTNSVVRVKHGDTVLGTANTGTGELRNFTFDVSSLPDGEITLTVEEAPTIDGTFTTTSQHSFTFTKDTTLANISSAAPTTATAGAAFTYDAAHPDEPTAGAVSYSLVNAPNGATINAETGVVSWTPSANNQVGLASFGVKVTDVAGNSKTQTLNIEVLRPLPALNAHLHADLSIFVNGTLISIPNGIGLNSSGQIAFPHIEGNDNRIHVHPMSGTGTVHPEGGGTISPTENITLGDFFETWRTNAGTPGNNPNATFSSTSLMGNNVVAGQTVVRMYVNGKLNTEYENYVLRDEDDITLTFETVGEAEGPTMAPIQNVTVFAGAPLYIPLNGFSPTGSNLTFSATSSNTSILTTGINNNNRSMRINVAGYGDMTFELFEDKAGDVVNEIIALIEANKYDGTIFHRVINGFVIQGGDPNGNGSNDENQPEFDDQFHPDLQHTSAGLLSMAKAGDDTNTSQFFITDAATRFLDFNHSIFGRLTSGDSVREAISNVAVNNSTQNRPLTNVVMNDVQVFMDHANGVLMLKAPEGATGTSNVTVTVTDEAGKTFTQTFSVTVAADTSNSPNAPPFLNDVADVTTTSGTPVNVQLTSTDVENGAVFYAIDPNGQDTGAKPYTATVNSTTGLVTITPNAGFVGSFDVTVGVRQNPTISTINDQWDTQTITVTVTPAAPSTPDLLDVSDTGISATDNITKGGSWQFTVGNVTNGATVKLFSGDTLLGQATASGTTATIAFDSSLLQDGQVQITAEQTVTINGVTQTSPRSQPLTVTRDTVAPGAFDFSTPLPTTAIVGQLYSYNFFHASEGTGFVYSLAPGAPAGVAINANTGEVTWTPTAAQAGGQAFTVRFADTAGNLREHAVNATVISSETQLVQFFILITDLQGNVITEIEEGEDFLVRVQVRDERGTPEGVFSAYTDMTYDASKVTAQPPITFGNSFPNARSGSVATAGLVDEAGGTSNTVGLGEGEFDVFTVRFTADATGAVTFATNPADDATFHAVLLFGVGAVIPNSQVTHAAASLTVLPATGAVGDDLTVTEDSSANTLNVLSNDTTPDGVTGPFTIESVTQPTTGGTVSIAEGNGSLLFTPTPNFTGDVTFTYTITNGAGFTDTATVHLNVANTNDPPTAVDDTLTINEDAANSPLLVLANDLTTPDPGETLTITAVTQPTSGGTVSIASDGKSLIFNPAPNFNGNVTFTYTINDGTEGSNDTATVNLTVTAVNDNPTAAADSQTVAEDAAATTIDVLANDGFAPDVGETIIVTAVTQGSQGGTVTVGTNGANVVYTPAANFNGTETFTYTISDGNGGTATATVTMTVTAVNDPPTAADDTATMVKNGAPLTVNVLNNDSSAPDTGETLTITAVTQPTTGGTVTIASDNKSIVFTPTAGFSGTVTFTYTIGDGTTGSTDTANVTITVQDFLPSDIAGYVYIDANGNGIRDAGEKGIAGVTVTLAGTSSTSTAVNQTATTLADGSYKFVNIAPGTYSVTQTQPQFMVDGSEQLGSFGGTRPQNDRMSFTIPENSHLTNYNFAEFGRQAQFVTMKDFLTSTPTGGSMATIGSNGTMNWIDLGPSYSAATAATGSLNAAKTHLTLNITENGQQFTATVALSDHSKVHKIGESGGAMLIRLLGNRSTLGFTAVPEEDEGQGEPPAAAAAAQSEPPPAEANTSAASVDESAPTEEVASESLPGPQGESSESFASESIDEASAAAYSASLLSTPATSTPAVTTGSDLVGPQIPSSLFETGDYGASSLVTPSASDAPSYIDNGSDSSGSLAPANDLDDETEPKSETETEEAPAETDNEADARVKALQALEDDAWGWLASDTSDDDDDTDANAEEAAVDELMSEGAWQEA